MFQAIIDIYNIRYIDLDIEGRWLNDVAAVSRTAVAMRKVQDFMRSSGRPFGLILTLPTMQSGLSAIGLTCLNEFATKGVELTAVNIMTMVWEPAPPGGQHGPIQAAATLLVNSIKQAYDVDDAKAWNMVGVTPILGKDNNYNADAYKYNIYDHDDASITKDWAIEKGIKMLSLWDVNNKDKKASEGPPSWDAPGIDKELLDISKICVCVEIDCNGNPSPPPEVTESTKTEFLTSTSNGCVSKHAIKALLALSIFSIM